MRFLNIVIFCFLVSPVTTFLYVSRFCAGVVTGSATYVAFVSSMLAAAPTVGGRDRRNARGSFLLRSEVAVDVVFCCCSWYG